MRTNSWLPLLILLASIPACSLAQHALMFLDSPKDQGSPPPALISAWNGDPEPLELRSVGIDVRVYGPLAETQMASDPTFPRNLASATMGAYFDLNRQSDARVVSEINHASLHFVSATAR